MFQWVIHCASTRDVRRARVACTIKPDWRYQKVIITAQPFILRRGRKVIASISGRRGLCRKHGASHTSMTMFHSGTLPRPVSVYAHPLVVATGRTTESIMVKTSSPQKSRTRFWESWPSLAAPTASVSTTTSRIGTSGIDIISENRFHARYRTKDLTPIINILRVLGIGSLMITEPSHDHIGVLSLISFLFTIWLLCCN